MNINIKTHTSFEREGIDKGGKSACIFVIATRTLISLTTWKEVHLLKQKKSYFHNQKNLVDTEVQNPLRLKIKVREKTETVTKKKNNKLSGLFEQLRVLVLIDLMLIGI